MMMIMMIRCGDRSNETINAHPIDSIVVLESIYTYRADWHPYMHGSVKLKVNLLSVSNNMASPRHKSTTRKVNVINILVFLVCDT